jgi:tyrosyl-tRNA synthetase
LQNNVDKLSEQLTHVFKNGKMYAQKYQSTSIPEDSTLKIVNNLDWFKSMTLLEFMSTVGKVTRVSSMLGRDSVKTRLENSSQGISFTEFSYQLFQAYDFYYLYRQYGCRLQIGGSDQWGNMMSGLELVRKFETPAVKTAQATVQDEHSSLVYGLTLPLLLTSNGKKFGKSAGNAIWLDATLTSPFDFYQVCLYFYYNTLYKRRILNIKVLSKNS